MVKQLVIVVFVAAAVFFIAKPKITGQKQVKVIPQTSQVEEKPKWAGIDLTAQQLILYEGNIEVTRYHISSGKSFEPRGKNKYPEVMWVVIVAGKQGKSLTYGVKTPYKWFLGTRRDDQQSYYNLHVAIHGYHAVSSQPASKACFRVSIPTGKQMNQKHQLPLGSLVQIQLHAKNFKSWRKLLETTKEEK